MNSMVLYGIISIFKRKIYPLIFFLQGRPGAKALMDFCQQLATMLSAGIPVLPALLIAAQQAQNYRLRLAIHSAINRVEQGRSLAEALAQEPRIFSAYFINMVEAGETGGVLDQALQRIAFHFERKNDLEQKIKTATAYPKFVLLIIAGVVVFLLTYVIPAFAATFAVMGAELPLPTSIVIALGEEMRTYWYLLVGGAAIVLLLLKQIFRTSWGAYYFHFLQLHLPLFGQLHRKLLLARFCRTLSAMLSCGIGLLTALELAKNVVQNQVFSLRIDHVKESIARGETVAKTLAAAGLFPQLVIGMVYVGEQSGKMDEMLARAAGLYETEVGYVVDRLGTLLEPALVIFLSIMVGGIVLSVFLPIFNVFSLYL